MSKQQSNEPEEPVVMFTSFNPPAVNLQAVPNSLQEVLNELAPSGVPAKAEELVGQAVTVHYMKPFHGSFGDALWCVLTDANGAVCNTVFGGVVLCEKLWTARERLPLAFTLVMRETSGGQSYYDAE